MISSLFVMLFLVAMVCFIVYHFYIDYSNWSNTGNTFAEGMTNPASGKGNLISIVSASQSSTGWGGEANRIVRDSGWDDNYGSGKCTHTNGGGWLRAKLDGRYDVTEVQILNRRDCCSGRIKNAKVYVLDGEKKHLCGVVATGNKGWLTVICPTEAVGNTIEVSTEDTNQHLTICGMKVLGNTVSKVGAADEKVPQKGTFISNEGREWKNQIPFKVSKNIYVFGGSDGGWFKMASVDSNGNFIENRHTKDCNSIDELTIEIWNTARRGGDYKVKDIIFVSAAPHNIVEKNVAGVGGWGGSCTCPDGQVYQVGDQNNYCKSLACIGGTSGKCNRHSGTWSNTKVTCGVTRKAPTAPSAALTAPAAPAAPTEPVEPNNLNSDQVLSRTTNSRSGINNPMEIDVAGNCKPGCIAPTGPFANCKNITQEGQPKKSCPYTCFNPTLEPNKCQYEQDCNACGIKIFNPDDEPNMDPKQPNMVPEQPYMDPKQPSFAGQQADIPNGSPQATPFQADKVNTSVQPNNPSWGTKTDGIQSTQSLATQSGNNTLFNEKIMTTVLGNKNLIPSDINITLDKQTNFIRIAKGFMQDLSNIRNVALPNIDNNDFELLGRVIAKIKIQENEQITGPQNDVMKKQLINSVNNILAGTTISNSQVDWESPRTTAKMSTTGMYNDNGNSMLGYGDKATKHHSEKSENGLCLWKGCEKNEKGKPYDSVYSLY